MTPPIVSCGIEAAVSFVKDALGLLSEFYLLTIHPAHGLDGESSPIIPRAIMPEHDVVIPEQIGDRDPCG